MFRITEDPSSESLVQCLAENYKNDSIVSVEIDKVHCSLYMKALPSYTVNYTHTHNGSGYTAITPTLSMSADTIESFL